MKLFFSKYAYIKLTLRIFTLLLIIIQSLGIRFFSGQGSILAIFILVFSASGLKHLSKRHILNLTLIFLFLILIKLLNPLSFELNKLVFQLVLVLEIYVFLLQYKKLDIKQLNDDVYETFKILVIHSAIGYILYLLLPFLFTETIEFGYPYKTLLNLFFVTNDDIPRNIGLLWEPGLLQLILNLFLFMSIQKDKSTIYLSGVVLIVFTTMSTTGFLGLGINYILYIVTNYKKKKQNVLILILLPILFSGSLYFIWDNISDKIGGENTSGLVRYRDFLIGVDLISEKPIFGHGLFDSSYLLSKSSIGFIEANIFSNEYLEISGDMGGGYTNGALAIFCWYGIPMGLLAFYACYRNKIIEFSGLKRICFFMILFFTLISEPITYTSFFLLFPLSYMIFHTQKSLTNNE